MTEIQSQGMQLAVDILASIAPLAVTLAVGFVLIKMFTRFIRGKA